VSHVVEIAFKGNRKEFFLWDGPEPPPLKAAVIVDADRGEDLGHVHAVGEHANLRNARAAHGLGDSPLTQKARRLATASEIRQHATIRADDEEAQRRAIERVRANSLVMKVTDAEWQWDRKKLTLYFTAEKRVDFRTLVRELASMFRTRIELKKIGVRDEAKRLDGYGRCGRQYCSAAWLPELRPVNLGVAKDQKLSLNPSQISGACGRLMCCLRYEHEFYVTTRRRFPKEGKVIRTSRGEEKVIANDLFRERVTLRGEEGEVRIIQLLTLREEMEALGVGLPGSGSTAPDRRESPWPARPEAATGEVARQLDSSVAEDVESTARGSATEASESQTVEGQADESERRRGRKRGRRGGRRGRTNGDSGSSPSSPPSSPN
jgi:cell fate regulator YaaT (PSP1 superfamily)